MFIWLIFLSGQFFPSFVIGISCVVLFSYDFLFYLTGILVWPVFFLYCDSYIRRYFSFGIISIYISLLEFGWCSCLTNYFRVPWFECLLFGLTSCYSYFPFFMYCLHVWRGTVQKNTEVWNWGRASLAPQRTTWRRIITSSRETYVREDRHTAAFFSTVNSNSNVDVNEAFSKTREWKWKDLKV